MTPPERVPAVAPVAPQALAPVALPREPSRPVKGARHTRLEVQQRRHQLHRRAQALPENLRRTLVLQLDEVRECRGAVERCWGELADIEKTFFPR